jgi:DNA-binding response OmpR family regulator
MRLLIVEGELGIRESINTSLTENGYTVDMAVDGEEGLYKALNWYYDLILVDGIVSKLNGWQVFNRLRKEKNTPVVMMKANEHVNGRSNGRNFATEDLLANLGSTIKNASNKATSILLFYQF